jgi:hypothetical protein
MTENEAPHGFSTTANRPNEVSCGAMVTLPPAASTAATASSVLVTEKAVVQPFAAPGWCRPRPPRELPSVEKVV